MRSVSHQRKVDAIYFFMIFFSKKSFSLGGSHILASSLAPLPPSIRLSPFRTVLELEIFDNSQKYPVTLKADLSIFETDRGIKDN
jgi:hypothetical protein